ncbi:MAG: adenylate/guanylate cyclase domain-containing protein [Bacteroidota bacterium]
MKPNQRRFLFKLIPYPIIAIIGGLLYFEVERGLLGSASIYPSTGNPYNSLTSFIGTIIMSLILGSVLGTIEELFFKNRLKRFPFFLKILLKTLIYVCILLLLLLVLSLIINSYNMGVSLFDREVINTILVFFTSFTLLSVIIYGGVIISVALFFSEIVDFLGLDVVASFFTGKYAKSVIEDRIFMFLDMKGSTAIAEKLGHEKHYQLINEYYSDMTEAIIKSKGHIYQYVGDEIVIFWHTMDGLRENNCLKCFFRVKNVIESRSDHYISEYGVVPTFKAGMHVGKVTRGQVGLIKRELLFTGDVLNTTARIQSMCNDLNTDLLISAELKDHLSNDGFELINKGCFVLKGRNQKATIFEIRKQA